MKFLASHESSTRGTFDFPIELYYVDKMHPRYEMPFHWHMEFELMLVLSGEFSLLIDYRKLPRLLGAGVKEGENTILHDALYCKTQTAK